VKTEQISWNSAAGWSRQSSDFSLSGSQLVLAFGSTASIERGELLRQVQGWYPNAYVLGCSTAGEIMSTRVFNDSLVITACEFEHTKIKTADVNLDEFPDSAAAGANLASALDAPGLVHVLVFRDCFKTM